MTALLPDLVDAVWANRAFLGRAVRYLAEHGVEQFIDIGTGLPTQDNVHEIARRVVPEARVVYVDHDPVVVSHGRALLAREPGLAMVEADARQPEEIVKAPEVDELIDWDKPVGLVLVAVLHFLEDPAAVLHDLCAGMVPGSHVVITHACADRLPAETRTAAITAYNQAINSPIHLRTEAQIARRPRYLTPGSTTSATSTRRRCSWRVFPSMSSRPALVTRTPRSPSGSTPTWSAPRKPRRRTSSLRPSANRPC